MTERPLMRWRSIIVALAITAVLVVVIGAAIAASTAYAQAGGGRVPACKTINACHRAIAWQQRDRAHLRRQLAVKWAPTRAALICPIATALDVSCSEARAVNRCESDTERMVSNSSAHVGWFQESSTFMSDNGLPWANAERWKPVVNVLAALLVVRREGWGQWTCQP
jgi:hypothetical protein